MNTIAVSMYLDGSIISIDVYDNDSAIIAKPQEHKELLMNTHTICFHGEIRKTSIPFGEKKCLTWNYETNTHQNTSRIL